MSQDLPPPLRVRHPNGEVYEIAVRATFGGAGPASFVFFRKHVTLSRRVPRSSYRLAVVVDRVSGDDDDFAEEVSSRIVEDVDEARKEMAELERRISRGDG